MFDLLSSTTVDNTPSKLKMKLKIKHQIVKYQSDHQIKTFKTRLPFETTKWPIPNGHRPPETGGHLILLQCIDQVLCFEPFALFIVSMSL